MTLSAFRPAWRGAGRAVALLALVAPVLMALGPVEAGGAGGSESDWLTAGERIYRTGVLPDGSPLQGTIGRDVVLSGRDAACATCHRKSGWGASEGSIQAPPVNARTLFAPVTLGHPGFAEKVQGEGARPAYTDVALGRALREGLDAAGRGLRPPMPRYDLSSDSMKALITYLRVLGQHEDPGVDATTIHLATIIAGPVSEVRREALLGVLRAFETDMNADPRNKKVRQRTGGWVTRWKYEGYRTWHLSVWELTGAASTWSAQLEAYYAKEPVFAVLSGIGEGSWRAVHEFCDRERIPCLFPITDEPVLDADDGYTFYFNRGAALEGEAVGRYLEDTLAAGDGPVIQVFREGTRGSVAANALEAALHRDGSKVSDVVLGTPPAPAVVSAAVGRVATPPVVVLWLESGEIATLGPLTGTSRIVVPSWVVTPQPPDAVKQWGGRVLAAFPYALPGSAPAARTRTRIWLRSRHLEVTDEKVQTGAYFAATALGDGLHTMLNRYSRDYLMECVEHMVDNALTSSVYPKLTLAPGQRFASKGSYVVALSTNEEGTVSLTPVTDWLNP